MEQSISYSAVVLDPQSKQKLKDIYGNNEEPGWEWIGHHMTINMGPLPEDQRDRIGQPVTLRVTESGLSDMAWAVGVEGYPVNDNRKPHITLMVNRAGGGKPFMSNKITDWDPTEEFTLTGTVQEIPNQPRLNESVGKMKDLIKKI